MEERRYGEIPTLECRRESNEIVDRQMRYKQIIECLKEVPDMTAREVASLMCLKGYCTSPERNVSHPRLNELCIRGIVTQSGKKICKTTGRRVTTYRLTDWMTREYGS